MQKSQLSTNTPHWPLDRLVPYEYNARTHSSVRLEQIANSIRHLRLHLYRPARHARSRRPEPHYRILTGRRPRSVMHKSQLSANTEHWPLDRLVPCEYNARTHSSAPLEQIANSIRQCGFTCTGRRATRTADAVLFHRRAGGGAMMDRPMEVTSDRGPVYMPELRIHARVGPRSLERLHHRPPGLANSRRCLLTPISIEAWGRTRRPSLQEPMPKSHYTSRWSRIRVLAPLPEDSTWIDCEYDSRAVRRSGRRIIGHGAAREGNVPATGEAGTPEPPPIPNGGTS